MATKFKYCGLFFLCGVLLGACGYRFPGGGGFPENVQHVFVDVLHNRTSETGVENIVTQSLKNEFVLRAKDKMTNDKSDADAILTGVVTNMKIKTIAAAGKNAARQRRVTLRVDLKLTRPAGDIIWAVQGLTDNQAYNVTGDKNLTETNRREAIALISRRLAEKILNRWSDDF